MIHEEYFTPRSSIRYPLCVAATIRCRGAVQRIMAEVHNLSVWGCRAWAPDSFARGDNVFVLMEGLESWTGFVSWSDRDAVGIYFEWPLYPAVVEHYAGNRMAGLITSRSSGQNAREETGLEGSPRSQFQEGRQ